MVASAFGDRVEELIERLHDAAVKSGCTVATTESLTGGQLAASVSSGKNAERWYRGGIVAYQPEVKHGLLRAPAGPVVTMATAAAMATTTIELFDADFVVSVSGVGGPGAEEGKPAGTVYIATCAREAAPESRLHTFAGDPLEVVGRTMEAALLSLIHLVEGTSAGEGPA